MKKKAIFCQDKSFRSNCRVSLSYRCARYEAPAGFPHVSRHDDRLRVEGHPVGGDRRDDQAGNCQSGLQGIHTSL